MTLPSGAHGDPGLQPERTSLAVTRTCVLMIATDVLLIRIALGSPVIIGLAAALGTVPTGILATEGRHHRRVVTAFGQERHQPPWILNLAVLLHIWSVAALSVVALVAT